MSKYVGVGLIIGGILGAAAMYGLRYMDYRFERPAGTWLEQAADVTMWDRRDHTMPLNNPDVVPVDEADHMRPDDIVVGIVMNGQARAYPWWILINYHVANDIINETPVYVGLCEVCSGASAFLPSLEELPGRPLEFRISGLGFGTFEIADIQTASKWHPFSGIALEGALKGYTLERIPTVLTRWETWKKLEPDTDVVFASQYMRTRDHAHDKPQEVGHPNNIITGSNLDDDRLPSNEMVHGIVGPGAGMGLAFPLSELRGKDFLELNYGRLPLLIFQRGEFQVMAYDRTHEGEELSFTSVEGDSLHFQDASGTVWNSWGQAISGPDEGAQLKAARGYTTEWYEWVSSFPNTTIFSEE